MGIEGGLVLSPEEYAKWKAEKPQEFAEYEEWSYQDEDGNWVLEEWPDWMDDGDPTNGPFDFALNPSQRHIGW